MRVSERLRELQRKAAAMRRALGLPALLRWNGAALRRARRRRGFTQRELGRRLGVDQAHVSRWEHATTSPNARHLRRIVRAFGRDFDARELL